MATLMDAKPKTGSSGRNGEHAGREIGGRFP